MIWTRRLQGRWPPESRSPVAFTVPELSTSRGIEVGLRSERIVEIEQ